MKKAISMILGFFGFEAAEFASKTVENNVQQNGKLALSVGEDWEY